MMTSNPHDELTEAGDAPEVMELDFYWDDYNTFCTVCGCNAVVCGGPTDPGDMDPDTELCACYDDELGEPTC